MANDEHDDRPEKPTLPQRKPLTAAQRARAQAAFDKGEQSVKQRNLDYAVDMFLQAVDADPGNLVYIKSFIETIQKKFNNKKKGSGFSLGIGGPRAALKKALSKSDFPTAVKSGLDLLKTNPWDIPALMQTATAMAGLGASDSQLYLLKQALLSHTDPGDVDINRACADALEKLGQFDQAMACWERVKKHHPNNDESQVAIASVHANKVQALGSTKDGAKAPKKTIDGKTLSREEELRAQHAENVADVGSASELSELLAREERYAEAEEVLQKTLQATGGDLKVSEQVEDMQLRAARAQLLIAEKRAQQTPNDENKDLLDRMKAEVNNVELTVYRARSDRYPGNTTWKYEMAVRLKKAGKFNDAIKAFQSARSDPKRKAMVMVELGKCFERIEQWNMAVTNYVESLASMTDRDTELRKQALYRAGVISMSLKPPDLDTAEKCISQLASIDFGYRDVAARLDKIRKMRNSE